MRFTIAAAGLVAVASASWAPAPQGYSAPANTSAPAAPVYTTEVLTQYTTYCPGPTQISHNGQTYTVTEATTLTITNCPCTVTKPVYSSVVSSCSTCSSPAAPTTPVVAPTYPASSPVAPVQPSSTPVAPYYPSSNGTVPANTIPATGTGAYSPPSSSKPVSPAGYTGAANKASFGVAGLLAAAGLVVAL